MDLNRSQKEYERRYGPHLKATEVLNGFPIRPGFYLEDGALVIPGGVSFTVHSHGAVACELLLYRREARKPFVVLPFPKSCRIGNVWSMIVFGIEIEEFEYTYRLDGPYRPEKGLLFDSENELLDPYAKAVVGQSVWGKRDKERGFRARVVANDFDWEDSVQPAIPMQDLIIYELHVRGYTRHDSSMAVAPGTFAGLVEKLPYLKELGVNAVELMPIFEFDELRDERMVNGKRLLDYWGYNPICFFAPNTSYAAGVEYNREGEELKSLIRLFHQNGIEVILDVVFNHTAEGDEHGSVISLKGFDNNIYYMLADHGKYYNFSGCGNTLNCNHPVVQQMILSSLRYWVAEYRIDGFRFDLASILGRNEDGTPMSKPPMLESLAFDPILGKTKLIAEAWDAGGLYQVGCFPAWNRWSEWNGKYRDDLRCFLKGDAGYAYAAACRIAGSLDLYDPEQRGENASVNFITCHDGFTLRDLYSYNYKHNESNGWNNTDGTDDNRSWNCGAEGPCEEEAVEKLRSKLIRNACAVLLASRGTPMLLAGDEFGSTHQGNNNAYCHDDEISWIDWSLLEQNRSLYEFFRYMIQFRKNHPVLRSGAANNHCGFPSSSMHGAEPWHLDQSPETRVIGVMFAGRNQTDTRDELIYVAVNAHWETHELILPEPLLPLKWRLMVDTARPDGNQVEINQLVGQTLQLEPRSVQIVVAEHSNHSLFAHA